MITTHKYGGTFSFFEYDQIVVLNIYIYTNKFLWSIELHNRKKYSEKFYTHSMDMVERSTKWCLTHECCR